METIRIGENEYACYEYVDDSYFGAEEINNELEYMRTVLGNLDREIGLENVPHRLVAYEEKGIDAFVTKNNFEYLFGISIGTFDELKKWFKMCFSNDKTYNALKLERESGSYYIQYTYRKALEFLLLHEYIHMKDGHCDIPENQEKLIFEQSESISREEAIFSQTLEFDADNWAVAHCTVKIIDEDISDEEKNEKLKLLMFSVYTIFKKFSEYDEYDFHGFMKDELLKYTHPAAWIRYRYIASTILTNILELAQEHKDILEKDLVNIIMDFESQVLNISESTEKMYAGAHTLKGTEHLLLLYNSWNEVADKLEKYSYDTLIRFTPMEVDAEKLSIVNANGNVIL